MNEVTRYPTQDVARPHDRGTLLDVLDRVLDKGVVIAGDIAISLLDIELLTIKIRLLIASADKAKEMGIDWWERDPQLSAGAQRSRQLRRSDEVRELERENSDLRRKLVQLQSRLNSYLDRTASGRTDRSKTGGG